MKGRESLLHLCEGMNRLMAPLLTDFKHLSLLCASALHLAAAPRLLVKLFSFPG